MESHRNLFGMILTKFRGDRKMQQKLPQATRTAKSGIEIVHRVPYSADGNYYF